MTSEELKLIIQKDEPLELDALAKALMSLNSALNEYTCTQTGYDGIKISLERVEKGSNVFVLAVGATAAFLEFEKPLNIINGFFELVKNIKDIGKKSINDIKEDKALTPSFTNDLENIINLAEQKGTSVTINYNHYKDCLIINQENKDDYKEGIRNIKRIKQDQNEKSVKLIYEKMNVSFYQTTNTAKKVNFKAFCYELSPKAIPTLVDDAALKAEILADPYGFSFICDLEVYKNIEGKITSYRAFNFIDKLEKDEKELDLMS